MNTNTVTWTNDQVVSKVNELVSENNIDFCTALMQARDILASETKTTE